MMKLNNSECIKQIIMRPVAYTKCRIGGDWYKNELVIKFVPEDFYPDYMEVNRFIMDHIDGKELNIEEVVALVRDMLYNEYNPKRVVVVDHVRGCKTHFDVTVIG